MNTKTMRLPPRRVLTPSGTTNKRKEREDSFERPKPNFRPIHRPGPEPLNSPTSTSTSGGGGSKGLESSPPSNQLLAGFLAHEFLTKGTLLGQPWGPSGPIEKKKEKAGEDAGGGGGATAPPPCRTATATAEERERYVKVTGLLMGGGGAHLPGVVNPTELARFLHL